MIVGALFAPAISHTLYYLTSDGDKRDVEVDNPDVAQYLPEGEYS